MKKICIGVAYAFILCLFFGCYSPRPVKGPQVAPQLVNSTWQHTPGLKLHIFNTGANQMATYMAGPNQPYRPVPAFVIEHPTQGLIVFDCGLAPAIAQQQESAIHPLMGMAIKARSAVNMDLASQMRRDTLVPENVQTVLLSHTHFDHTGSTHSFTRANFLAGVGARNWSNSWMKGIDPTNLDWIPREQWQEIDFSESRPYATFPKTKDVFGDGSLVLIEAEGHTKGDLAALVQLPEGPVLLTGDAVVHFDWLSSDDVQKAALDQDKAATFRNQVRALQRADSSVVILPGHDLSSVPTHRQDIILHRPEYFQVQAWPIQ